MVLGSRSEGIGKIGSRIGNKQKIFTSSIIQINLKSAVNIKKY